MGKREDNSAAVRERSETKDAHTILGSDAKFSGKLTFEGAVRIDGHFEGEIFTDDILLVGPSAEVHAALNVGSIVIHGLVDGDVVARTLVEIKSPGRLRGNVVTPNLMIEKGVTFDGTCRMSQSEAGEVVPIPKSSNS